MGGAAGKRRSRLIRSGKWAAELVPPSWTSRLTRNPRCVATACLQLVFAATITPEPALECMAASIRHSLRHAVSLRAKQRQDDLRDTPQGMPNLNERLEMRELFKSQQDRADSDLPRSLTKYDVIGLIGEGATARVYLCEPLVGRPAGELYAMKVFCKTDVEAREKQDDVERERKILQMATGHPFVLNAHACFGSDNFEFLVLGHCPGGDLFEVQSKFPNQRMSESAARFYFTEVMLGCECIHDLGFVIRDLKPENVLIDEHGHCRVSDFDLAIEKDRPQRREPLVGTAEYLPPEILKTVQAKTPKGSPGPDVETCDSSTVTEAADVWVLGLMLFEMLHGYAPFSRRVNETLASCRERIIDADNPNGWLTSLGKVKSKAVAKKGKKGKKDSRTKSGLTQVINVSSGAKAVISACLAADPTRRPRVIALRDQKWLKGIEWREATARKLKPPWVPGALTPSATDVLRASSKAAQTRRCSIDRPGWAGHSVLAEQQRATSRLLEQSSNSDTASKPEPDQPPSRGPSRISGDLYAEKSQLEGVDATTEMMMAMYALKVEDSASVGPSLGADVGQSTADEEELVAPRLDGVGAGRPRGVSEPTTTVPPLSAREGPGDSVTGATPTPVLSTESAEGDNDHVEGGSPVP